METTSADILNLKATLNEHSITRHGFATPNCPILPWHDLEFPNLLEQVGLCERFLNLIRPVAQESRNVRCTSFFVTQAVEKWSGIPYVHHAAVIVAAIRLGFPIERVPGPCSSAFLKISRNIPGRAAVRQTVPSDVIVVGRKSKYLN